MSVHFKTADVDGLKLFYREESELDQRQHRSALQVLNLPYT
jgi:hypothetical protein